MGSRNQRNKAETTTNIWVEIWKLCDWIGEQPAKLEWTDKRLHDEYRNGMDRVTDAYDCSGKASGSSIGKFKRITVGYTES